MHLNPFLIATFATLTTLATAALITSIAPDTASCDGAPFPDECRTAAQAAKPIADSFTTYGITSAAEQAALLSLILYESTSFKYNKNHYPAPGRPGQGTRNMQMPKWNLKYAQAVGVTMDASDPAAVLDVLNANDGLSFGSAAWYLTGCAPDVRTSLQTGTQVGWAAYLTQCVGTTDTADRDTIWVAAKAAMGF